MNFDWTFINEIYGSHAWVILQSVIALVIALIFYRLFTRSMHKLADSGMLPNELVRMIIFIVRVLFMIVVLLLVLGFFGVSVQAFWAALSGVLVLVALGFVAVWSVLSNVLCSVLIVVFAPFRIGDEVEIQDPGAAIVMRGKVRGINMIFTTLEPSAESSDTTGMIIRVPNNVFFQKYLRCWPAKT